MCFSRPNAEIVPSIFRVNRIVSCHAAVLEPDSVAHFPSALCLRDSAMGQVVQTPRSHYSKMAGGYYRRWVFFCYLVYGPFCFSVCPRGFYGWLCILSPRRTILHTVRFSDSDSVRCLAAGGKPADLEQVSGLRGAD